MTKLFGCAALAADSSSDVLLEPVLVDATTALFWELLIAARSARSPLSLLVAVVSVSVSVSDAFISLKSASKSKDEVVAVADLLEVELLEELTEDSTDEATEEMVPLSNERIEATSLAD